MCALPRIGVLVKVRAIELRQAEGVTGKMRGSPVQKNAYAGLVAAVDKLHKLSGRAVAAGGSEIADGLVAPGTVERVLHDGKQLDMCVAEVFDVRNELIAQFAVVEPAVVVFGHAAPGAEVDFVDGDWRFEPILLRTLEHPQTV